MDYKTAEEFDGIDLTIYFNKLRRGLPRTIGYALIGCALGAALYFFTVRTDPVDTTARISLGFNGHEKGEYPDHSKFQPDDLRSPQIVEEAVKRQGLAIDAPTLSSIREAIAVLPDTSKDKDRVKATSSVPDEYLIRFSSPESYSLGKIQRERLLNDLVGVYRDSVERAYATPPVALGNAFLMLRNSDYFEYQIVLEQELQNIAAYLKQQLDQSRSFRSRATGLSFNDLLMQTRVFALLRMNETLGMIEQSGFSRNRDAVRTKMDYYLETLQDQEHKAMEEEKVIKDLLTATQERASSYVLGAKTTNTAGHSDTPVLDQGLIDSLLANDAYNFLVRKALDAGLKTKGIQAEESQLLKRRAMLDNSGVHSPAENDAINSKIEASLKQLEAAYNVLIADIRLTDADYTHQAFADSVKVDSSITTGGGLQTKFLIFNACLGFVIGGIFGMGLSLLIAEKIRALP